jgi:hypothetical protein
MSHTFTRTYTIKSRHFIEPWAKFMVWWLNRTDTRSAHFGHDNYAYRFDGSGKRHHLVIDWGGQ